MEQSIVRNIKPVAVFALIQEETPWLVRRVPGQRFIEALDLYWVNGDAVLLNKLVPQTHSINVDMF